MALVRWEPLRNAATLQDRINRMFDDAFSNAFPQPETAETAFRPVVDIHENQGAVFLEAELPGVRLEDIEIEVDNQILYLKGEKVKQTEVEGDRYHRKERVVGRFQRAFTLPDHVDAEAIRATLKDGILTLEVPKPPEKKARKIAIEVAEA